MNDNKDIEKLLQRIQQGEATHEDLQLYQAWCDAFQREPKAIGDFSPISKRMLDSIHHTIHEHTTKRPKRLAWMPYAAAAVLLIASAVGYFALENQKPTGHNLITNEILPGGNKATLTLADGRTIALDETQTGIVIGEKAITYTDGSALDAIPAVANALPRSDAKAQGSSALIELNTPKGGTYSITLPDGSRVWLNAASTLKYPARFSDDIREVFLEGEAFFEVRKSPSYAVGKPKTINSSKQTTFTPFSVHTAGQTVEVLGTEFNISSYTEDGETQTTLVSGKVNVTANNVGALPAAMILAPSEQARLKNGQLGKNQADLSHALAWRNGLFTFRSEKLVDIMRKVARWYDIDVIFQGDVANRTFSGTVSRYANANELLETLALTGLVRFELSGKRITVMPTDKTNPSK